MKFDSFQSFYPFYLSQHRRPATRALHMMGLIVVFSLIVIAGLTHHWWILALIPIAGYGPAWIGHFFFEKNRPATFRYPFYSLLGDFVMFKDTMLGKKLFPLLAIILLTPGIASAQETETAPIGSTDVSVRYTITNGGIDAEAKGIYAIYPVDNRTREIGHANSGYEARIPAGTYDVAFRYRDGTIKKEIWMKKQLIEETIDQTVEMNVVPAEVIVHVNRLGQPIRGADCALYSTGQKTDPVARLLPDEATRVAESLYDVSCVYTEQDLAVEQWQLNQAVAGKKDVTFNFDFKKATFRIVDPPAAAPPISSLVQLFPAGTRDKSVARGVIGAILSFPAGTYDVMIQRNQKTAAWLGIALEGDVSVPFTDTPPASVLKNVSIAPETQPETRVAESRPATPETKPISETRPETRPVTPPQPLPPPTGPNGLPLPPNLTNVPAAPFNWHGWFGCSLLKGPST